MDLRKNGDYLKSETLLRGKTALTFDDQILALPPLVMTVRAQPIAKSFQAETRETTCATPLIAPTKRFGFHTMLPATRSVIVWVALARVGVGVDACAVFGAANPTLDIYSN